MQIGDKRTFMLELDDVGVYGSGMFIYVEGIGYVANRNICTGKSYDYLEKCGYVTGKEKLIDGESYLCRILKCTEWDDCMDYGNSDEVWHWGGGYSWVRSIEYERAKSPYRVLRGYNAASILTNTSASNTGANVGFRPVLEVLKTCISAPTITTQKACGEINITINLKTSKI